MTGKREAPRRKGKKPPLPVPLRVLKVAATVALYAAMLALVLIFFQGNGIFIYEGF